MREGCARLSAVISDLPVNTQTAYLLVKLLLRLDKKLQVGGVDDASAFAQHSFDRSTLSNVEGF